MAITTYPLNNILYNAEDAEIYNSTRTSGVFASDDFEIAVTGDNNNVMIKEGLAWIHNGRFTGKAIALKKPQNLTLSLPNNIYDRIDSIVLQFDRLHNETALVIKEGLAESSPKPPEVVQQESVYELHLYHIRRKAGAMSIKSQDITDVRDNPKYCGKMYDAVTNAQDIVKDYIWEWWERIGYGPKG